MEDSDEDREETENKSQLPRELQSGYTSVFNFENNKKTNDDKQEKAMKHFVFKGKQKAAFYSTCKQYLSLEQTDEGQADASVKFF